MKGFVRKALACAVVGVFSFSGLAQEIVGELANYKLDKSRARTTSMIKRGTVVAEVIEHLPNDPDGAAYMTKMDYDLRVSFVGEKKGTVNLKAPEEFFTEAFLKQLRQDGQVDTPKFKVRHLGYGDAKNMDKKLYKNADIIEIYDVDTSTAKTLSFFGFAYSVLQDAAIAKLGPDGNANIEDLVIKAYVHSSVPVIGAAKIDLSGKTSGYNFKAGFDFYIP